MEVGREGCERRSTYPCTYRGAGEYQSVSKKEERKERKRNVRLKAVSEGDEGVVGDSTGDAERSGSLRERVGAGDKVLSSGGVVNWEKKRRVRFVEERETTKREGRTLDVGELGTLKERRTAGV
jgi:hypothetical protein